LRVVADQANNYFETTRSDNTNWADFHLTYTSDGKAHVSVFSQGPQPG
jgi:hypothetical protein